MRRARIVAAAFVALLALVDTFGAVCHHENGHYTHFRDNWFTHRAASPFSVAEDANHNSIEDSVEAATDPDAAC